MSKFDDLITEYSYMFTKSYRIDTVGGVQQGHLKDDVFAVDKTVSRKPILPIAIMDNVDAGVQKVQIGIWDLGRWKKIVVEREVLTNSSKIIKLANQGVPVGTDNSRLMAQYFNDLLAEYDEKIPRNPARSVMGWVEQDEKRLFMPYEAGIDFDGEDSYKYLYDAIKQRGTLQEWVDYCLPHRLCIEIRLVMAAAFASPLIELVGENPFVMHLWGGTGTAKTVSLLIAASIYGDPKPGKLVRTMDMTANAMRGTAAFLNSIPFCGDELQTIKSKWNGSYDQLIMQITEGIDRGRMKYNSIEDIKSWKCSFLFTGEEPCVKAGSGGGVANRVIQIEVSKKLVDDGNAVANFFRTHFGTAGPEYIRALQSGLFDIDGIYRSYFSDLIKTDTTDKQAGAMALMLTGDKIAHDVFWPDEPEMTTAMVVQYLASARQVDVSERAYQYACGVVSENSCNFTNSSRIVWGQANEDGTVYINRSVLARILTDAGYDFEACKKAWERNGYLLKRCDGRFSHSVKLNEIVTSCIKLKLPNQDQPQLTDFFGAIPFTED
jgi:hypothetical protein